MRFDIITIFPKMFSSPFAEGVVGQAIKHGKIKLETWDPREVTQDVHRSVDDRPFGGGPGMVMLPEVLKATLDRVAKAESSRRRVIYLSPQGAPLTSMKSRDLAENYDQVVLICGRYGGIDERFLEKYVDEEISVGDFVLSGGEIAAMAVVDSVSRFLPGVLGNEQSPDEESFHDGLLEQPLYTRPWDFEGETPPEVLRSGHHQKIKDWQKTARIQRTLEKRPDLLANSKWSYEEIREACRDLNLANNVAIGLVHYPVYNKNGEVVATNVTNLDVHDIARASRTFGIERFYVITPAEEQLSYVGRMLKYWQKGRGLQFNPTRSEALLNTRTATSVEAAITDWGVKDAVLVGTSARKIEGPNPIDFSTLRVQALKKPHLLLFGTGYGLENSLVRQCQFLLEPIRGRAPDGFKHLSVRSAVSIVLDRLFGSCY